MSSAYFAPLVLLPVIVTEPGRYQTRRGESVVIESVSRRHDFRCVGYYGEDILEGWHKSGRVLATSETDNDIVKKID